MWTRIHTQLVNGAISDSVTWSRFMPSTWPKSSLRHGAISLLAIGVSSPALGAPGDILFSETFDAGPVACGTLAPNWATTDANLGEIGTFTSNSNACSLFTRGAAVTVSSIVIDTSSIDGADLTVWVRKGADAFSEDPDGAGENLILEYFDVSGVWLELQTFSSPGLADGAVTLVNLPLPFGALHSDFRVRFRQLGGSGGPPANGGIGFDFWHIDDVVLTENGTPPIPPPPPPPPTLTANSCDDFEGGQVNFIVTDATRSDISGATFSSPSNSLFLRHGPVSATSVAIPATGLEQVTMVVQRGSDTFSENPDAGENLLVEFLDDTGSFVLLESFPGAGTQGEVFNRTFTMPASAQHAGFRLRFTLVTASGVDFDYWHVDDVCLISELPDLSVNKTVVIESDPSSGSPTPFGVPGAFARYTIEVVNNSGGVVDIGSLDLSDIIDTNTALFVGDLDGSGSPFVFTDGVGAAASGVSLNFGGLGDGADGVTFRNSSNGEIVPVPNFDLDVASFDLSFDGAMLGMTSGTPTRFSVEYRVRLQ